MVWAEWLALVMIIVGFVIAMGSQSAAMNYFVSLTLGLFAGRYLYNRKLRFSHYLAIIGLLVGYMLGMLVENLLGRVYGSWKVTFFLFIFGTVVNFYFHEKGYIG